MHKLDLTEWKGNPFELIGKQWALLAAGTPERFNMMTVSWGALGVIWGKPSATVYVRESRYTKEFVDGNEYFTLSFLKEGHGAELGRLGSRSGRDIDKMHDSGLTPNFVDGQPTFAEAELVLVCRKVYSVPMPLDRFLAHGIREANYPTGDPHVQYIGEIVAAYTN